MVIGIRRIDDRPAALFPRFMAGGESKQSRSARSFISQDAVPDSMENQPAVQIGPRVVDGCIRSPTKTSRSYQVGSRWEPAS